MEITQEMQAAAIAAGTELVHELGPIRDSAFPEIYANIVLTVAYLGSIDRDGLATIVRDCMARPDGHPFLGWSPPA